jgi:hypothetical protein
MSNQGQNSKDLEYWNAGIMAKMKGEFVSENIHHSNFPFFHYSVSF